MGLLRLKAFKVENRLRASFLSKCPLRSSQGSICSNFQQSLYATKSFEFLYRSVLNLSIRLTVQNMFIL
jgi:hypothetical protein